MAASDFTIDPPMTFRKMPAPMPNGRSVRRRQLEMEACSKALAVLSSDEAHDLFTKTNNPAFIQEEESTQHRNAAAKVLKFASRRPSMT